MAKEILADEQEPTAEEIFQMVLACEPMVPPADMERLADLVRSNDRLGRPWRLAALIGSKDGEFFKEVSEKEDMAEAMMKPSARWTTSPSFCRRWRRSRTAQPGGSRSPLATMSASRSGMRRHTQRMRRLNDHGRGAGPGPTQKEKRA